MPGELRDRQGTSLWTTIVARSGSASPGGEPVFQDGEGVARDLTGLVRPRGEGVEVRDEEVTLVLVLERTHAVLERADPVADVEPPPTACSPVRRRGRDECGECEDEGEGEAGLTMPR